MSAQPFRTGATWLTDDQLILLDVLFDRGATIRLLRRGIFHEQWNLGYVHSLDDVELKNTLHLLCEHGVLKPLSISERVSFRMTRVGGEMWSLERCPDWTRYCTEQYRDLSGGRTLMTVMAASPVVRDHFLALWPKGPARRKTAVIADRPLIEWHPFPQLYVGLAIYEEQRQWTPTEFAAYSEWWHEHWNMLERERSWWRYVPELQKFVVGTN